jgi:tetratricopeptide (TPR) repeat protein
MKKYIRLLLVLFGLGIALALPDAARASGGGGSETYVAPADPDLVNAKKAIEKKNWDMAIELLNKAVTRDARNAEIHNLLGFAERSRGNLDAAFKHYERALELDPKHRGAHEYIGEAYLMAGNLAKAEEHLAKLDKLCLFPCDEYRDLKAAIAKYKQEHPK